MYLQSLLEHVAPAACRFKSQQLFHDHNTALLGLEDLDHSVL